MLWEVYGGLCGVGGGCMWCYVFSRVMLLLLWGIDMEFMEDLVYFWLFAWVGGHGKGVGWVHSWVWWG